MEKSTTQLLFRNLTLISFAAGLDDVGHAKVVQELAVNGSIEPDKLFQASAMIAAKLDVVPADDSQFLEQIRGALSEAKAAIDTKIDSYRTMFGETSDNKVTGFMRDYIDDQGDLDIGVSIDVTTAGSAFGGDRPLDARHGAVHAPTAG